MDATFRISPRVALVALLAAILVGTLAGAGTAISASETEEADLEGLMGRLALVRGVTDDTDRYSVYQGVVDQTHGRLIVVVDETTGEVVRDHEQATRLALAAVFAEIVTSDEEITDMRRISKEYASDYAKIDAVLEGIRGIRDGATRMLVDVGIAYMVGDPGSFTREATRDLVKDAAKDALRDAIASIAADPKVYLRALTAQALMTAGDDLISLADQAQMIYAGDPVYVGEMEAMRRRLGRAYSTIVPAQQLISDLRPGASLTQQFSDFVDTVAQRLQSKMPSEISDLYQAPSYESLVGAAGTLDEVLSGYEGYRDYRAGYQSNLGLWRQRFEFVGTEVATGIEEVQRLEVLRRGDVQEGVPDDATSQAAAAMPMREETIGIVSGDQEEATFLVDIPAGFMRVELAVAESEPTAWSAFAGTDASMEVHGRDVWWVSDGDDGVVVHDEVDDEEVTLESGAGRWFDITGEVAAGEENEITFSHRPGGPDISVGMRITAPIELEWLFDTESDPEDILLTEDPWSLTVSDGASLYRFDGDGSLLWQTEPPAWICPVDTSRDGSLVVIGTCTNRGGDVILYGADGRELWRERAGAVVSGASIATDGQTIVASSYLGALRKFDRRGGLVFDWEERYPETGFPCDPDLVRLLDDRGAFATAGDWDGGCLVGHEPDGRIAWQVHGIGEVHDVEVSNDGALIVVGTHDVVGTGRYETIRAYDRSGQEAWHVETDEWHAFSVAIAGDTIIALVGRYGNCCGLHVMRRTGDLLWSSDGEETIEAAATSGDGQVIATADEDGRVGITLRSVDGAVLGKIYPPTPEVTAMALSHDGRSIFVGARYGDLMHFRR
jgi:hypothetical protein